MASNRVVRGRQTERMLADYLRADWPDAIANAASLSGDDVRNVGQLAIEVKATATLPLLAALRQVHTRSGPSAIPVVVWRPNGYGEARIDEWVVATRVATFFGPIAQRGGYFI